MSFLKPKQYYQIVEQMGEAYSRIRDSLNDGSSFTEVDPSSWTSLEEITDGTTGDYPGAASTGDKVLQTNARDFAENVVQQVVSEPDDNSDETSSIVHGDRDPIGSIASDLGRKMTDLSAQFTEEQAKLIAASYFGSALKALNSHVVSKTPLPPTVPQPPGGPATLRNINEYYFSYGDDPRSEGDGPETSSEMGLFTWQEDSTGDYFTGGYFSANFVELSAQNNITIDAQFQAATWV